MTAKIYLIRHGQTDWNLIRKTQGQTDVPLNETGKSQAEQAADFLSSYTIKRIYASDLSRARTTAEIINRRVNAPLILDNRLREYNYGDFEGVFSDTISPDMWQVFNAHPDQLHAESKQEIFNRISSFFKDLPDDENTLIVTHGGILRVVLYCVEKNWQFDGNDFLMCFNKTRIPNAAIYEWDREQGTIQLISGD